MRSTTCRWPGTHEQLRRELLVREADWWQEVTPLPAVFTARWAHPGEAPARLDDLWLAASQVTLQGDTLVFTYRLDAVVADEPVTLDVTSRYRSDERGGWILSSQCLRTRDEVPAELAV